MATVTIELTFSNGYDEQTHETEVDVWSGTDDDIQEAIDNWRSENGDDWDCVGEEVTCFDDDYDDPANFDGWPEYAEYCDLVDKHGEGFALRYEDVIGYDGDQFEREYRGCWDDIEAYVKHELDENYNIPDFLVGHIDYESLGREWSQGLSTYDGDEGLHIFRD